MSYKTYVSRKSRLLKGFDRSVSRVKQVLIARYGEDEGNTLMRESRREYEDLIPQIPYIGDRNPLLIFLLPASRYLAIYRTFQKHGRSVEEVGRLVYEIGEAEFEAIPGWVRRIIGVLWFSRWFVKRLQKRAASSQERKYSGGYVLAYVEGDGQDFGPKRRDLCGHVIRRKRRCRAQSGSALGHRRHCGNDHRGFGFAVSEH